MLFLLFVATEEAEKAVVGDGTEKLDGREHVAAVQHNDERNVDERVSEVTIACQQRESGSDFQLAKKSSSDWELLGKHGGKSGAASKASAMRYELWRPQ